MEQICPSDDTAMAIGQQSPVGEIMKDGTCSRNKGGWSWQYRPGEEWSERRLGGINIYDSLGLGLIHFPGYYGTRSCCQFTCHATLVIM